MATNPFDQFDPPAATTSNPFDQFDKEPPEPSGALRRLGDLGIAAVQGAIAVPEAAVGLANLVTGGKAGKLAEQAGFRPKEAKEILAEYSSPELKAAKQNFQQADGVLAKTGVAITNPSLIADAVVQSLPATLGGGVAARGILAAAPKLGAVGAGAVGEGLVGAGASAEAIRQESADGELSAKQSLLAAGSGLATGAFGALGGAAARKLGIGDVDTALATGTLQPGVAAANKGIARRAAEGFLSEGFLEELPQSLSEQAIQNYALDRPLTEGLADAGVLGVLSGGALGAGAAAISGRPAAPVAPPAPEVDPNAGPISRAASLALPAPVVSVDGLANAATADQRNFARQYVQDVQDVPFRDVTPVPGSPVSNAAALLASNVPQAPADTALQAINTVAEEPAPPRALSLEEADARDQAAYDEFFANTDAPEFRAELAPTDLLDDNIPWDEPSSADTRTFLTALGATDQEIEDAIAQESSRPQAGNPGSAGGQTNDAGAPRAASGADQGQAGQVGGNSVGLPPAAAPLAGKADAGRTDNAGAGLGSVQRNGADAVAPVAAGNDAPSAVDSAVPPATPGNAPAVNATPIKIGERITTTVDGRQVSGVVEKKPFGKFRVMLDGETTARVLPADAVARAESQPNVAGTSAEAAQVATENVAPETGAPAPSTGTQQAASIPNATPKTPINSPIAPATAPVNEYAKSWFGSAEKAAAFLQKKGAADRYDVVKVGPTRFEVKPKEQSNGTQADQAFASTPQREAPGKTVTDSGAGLAVGQHSGGGKVVPTQDSADGHAADAKFVGDLPDRKSFVEKGYDGLNADDVAVVQRHMLRISENPQVLNSVVQLVPVDVMDMLAAQKLTPKMLFDNPAMLQGDSVGRDGDDSVSIPVDAATSIVRAMAGVAAENLAPGKGAKRGGPSVDSGSANSTGQVDAAGLVGGTAGVAAEIPGGPDSTGPQRKTGLAVDTVDDGQSKNSDVSPKNVIPEGRIARPEFSTSRKIPSLQSAMASAGWKGETGDNDTIWTKQAGGDRYIARLTPSNSTMEVTVLVDAVDTQIASFKADDAKAAAAAANKAVADDVAESEANTPVPTSAKRTKADRAAADAEAARADYFTPGNIVNGYGGLDEVLSYKATSTGGFSVTVQRVNKIDGEWVREGRPDNARTHATRPEPRELKTGPVERLPFTPGGQVKYTDSRADGKPFPNVPDRGVAPVTAVAVPSPAVSAKEEKQSSAPGRFTNIEVPASTVNWLGFDGPKNARADLAALAQRHPEYYDSPDEVRQDIDFVLGKPDGWYIHKGNRVVLFRERVGEGAIPQARVEVEADADTMAVRSVYVGGKRQIAKKMADKRGVLGGLDLGGQSPESLTVADYLSILGNGSSRPDSPSGESLKAELTVAKSEAGNKRPSTSTQPAIEDFGEKLTGARKDYAALLKDAEAVDVSAEPLSKSWPEPDYQKLLASGVDPFVVGWVRASRDEVPTKPQKGWKLKGWVESVKLLRSVSGKLLDGSITKDVLTAQLGEAAFRNVRDNVGGRAELYQAVGHEKSLKGLRLTSHSYTFYRGQEFPRPGKTLWHVEQVVKATAFGNWPREIVTADTREQVIAAFKEKYATLEVGGKAKSPASFSIYSRRGQPGAFIGKKIGREYVDLHKADDLKSARAYLEKNTEALEKALARYKDTPYERSDDNTPRVGADHRGGALVTPQVFSDTFGFRGVQFGNYVEQGRRQSDLNEAYDALMDMAAVLELPPRALSLGGRLGLAFGARGRGGKNAPAAHYEPGLVVINLTKGGGPGSLAHEWFHAMDNYFAKEGGTGGFMTDKAKGDALRAEMRAAFMSIRRALQASGVKTRSVELDKRRSKPYWSTPEEMAARTFESYVIAKLQDQSASNDYLANVVSQQSFEAADSQRLGEASEVEKPATYPYPTEQEMAKLRTVYDEFFKTVQTKQDEAGNTVLFSRQSTLPASKGQRAAQTQGAVDAITKAWQNGPEIIVVRDMQDPDVPEAVRKYDAKQRSLGADGTPEGFYFQGKVYVVASMMANANDVARVVFHEALGHFGLQNAFGSALKPILKQVATMRAADVKAKAVSYGLDVKVERQMLLAAEEVLAEMAQTRPEIGFVRRAIAAIRTWLRANVPSFNNLRMSDDELVRNFILPAREFVERGRKAELDQVVGNLAPAFSREGQPADNRFAADVLTELAQYDALFKLPASSKTDLAGVIADIDPTIQEVGDATREDERQESGADQRTLFRSLSGRDFYVYERGREVWIDVSRFDSGQGGDAVYQAVANYAYNAKKVFVGDPSGLSADAVERRTYHMLGSALRFGATDHFQPAPEQLTGVAEKGVSPLKWQGNDGEKLASLVKSFTETLFNRNPKLRDYRYDFDTRKFVNPDGKPVARDSLLLGVQPRAGAESGGSRRTPAAGVFLNSLALQPSGKKPGLLALSGRRAPQLVDGLDGPLFSRANDQTQTDAFKRWFGDSKVVDAEGKPLVVYHGTEADFSAFSDEFLGEGNGNSDWGDGFYFATKPVVANSYAQADGANVMPVYLSIKNPADLKVMKSKRVLDAMDDGYFETTRDVLAEMGYDGIVIDQGKDGKEIIAFRPEQIKSATGNNGNFDPADPDIRFSRANGAKDVDALKAKATDALNDLFNVPGKLNWWQKTVGTMYDLAERNPAFKRVFDAGQAFINDVSAYATQAANLAPNILPKLETWRDIAKSPLSAADTKAIAAPIFEGTLLWARDESGKLVRFEELQARYALMTYDDKAQVLLRLGKVTEAELKRWKATPLPIYEGAVRNRFDREFGQPGVVFSDAELRSQFKLTDGQIKLYREFRAATDKSLNDLAVSDMLRYGGKDVDDVRSQVVGMDANAAALVLADHLREAARAQPDRADLLADTANKMIDKADRVAELVNRGYAPLSRFGQYTLDVVDENGERVYFGLFESRMEAGTMARKMKANFPGAQITQGTMSEQSYKLFAGVSPETLELFGEMLGLEGTGNDAQSQAFQQYLKLAKSNRSALKRLIERKGIAGFSEDAGRVLAGFVYSNARQTASNLHLGEMTEAANAIPQQQGELKDVAIKLSDYIKNPQEEAQAVRGLLFAQYLGGNIASALVNMTQPIAVTTPYLSQFGGAAKAARRMSAGIKDALKPTTGDKALDAALLKAEAEGIVAPQEVHQLLGQAQGRGSLKSGDGTRAGDAAAAASNALSKLSLAWGKLFGAAEQFNRRSTFIAAYRTAVEEGLGDPALFAQRAIEQTQFVYNKGNRPQWARGAIGTTLFTFKQYSISYVELLTRMANAGEPGSPERAAGRRAALLAVGMLFLMGGAGGLPFAEDAEDVVDGVLQRMGYNFSTKQAKKEFLTNLLGQGGAHFVENGISGLPGVPIDVSGRLGLGNLLPGTGLFTKKADYTRDVTELAGPAGDLVKRGFQAVGKLAEGEVGKAAELVLPVAGQNLTKAVEMASTGIYTDKSGKKVLDVDGFDALAKGIGFQPADVARVQEATGRKQNMIAQNKLREAEIADMWALGVFKKDPDKVQRAREALAEWNENNPDTPIRIQLPQIVKRVRAMSEDKATRIAKTAPTEIRAGVRRELAEDLPR